MPLYEYACGSHISELLLPSGFAGRVECRICGSPATRRPSTFRQIAPSDSIARRQGYSRFTEASQEIDHAYSRAEAIEAPGSVQSPNLWGIAKARAAEITASGEAPASPN